MGIWPSEGVAENVGEGATGTLTSAAGVVAIDLNAIYSHYTITLTENVTSWTFSNLPATGYYKEINVVIIQNASSAKTVVTPATAGRTAGGLPWVASTVLSSREVLVLQCFSDATRTLFPTGPQV